MEARKLPHSDEVDEIGFIANAIRKRKRGLLRFKDVKDVMLRKLSDALSTRDPKNPVKELRRGVSGGPVLRNKDRNVSRAAAEKLNRGVKDDITGEHPLPLRQAWRDLMKLSDTHKKDMPWQIYKMIKNNPITLVTNAEAGRIDKRFKSKGTPSERYAGTGIEVGKLRLAPSELAKRRKPLRDTDWEVPPRSL